MEELWLMVELVVCGVDLVPFHVWSCIWAVELVTWVAYVKGVPSVYFELERHEDGSVEILYFGIMARYFGKGLGGHLLTETVERAWELGANRVWLHTCTHDHEHALANYLARGFKVFKTEKGSANRPRESALFSRPKFV